MIKKRAYAKINLSLDVIGKLENGYHEVCMVMQTVGLFDELSFDITDVGDRIPDRIQIIIDSEKEITADNKDNLVYKAANMLLPYIPEDKGVRITLKKNIPMAAGMAGGSTDAAAASVSVICVLAWIGRPGKCSAIRFITPKSCTITASSPAS